jgi:hypothetical protein
VSRFNPQRRHSVTTSSLAAADSLPSGCIQANQEMADFGGLRQFNSMTYAKVGQSIFVLARGSHRAVSPSQDWRAATASCLQMLLGLEGAHAFYVSIFGGVEHLRLAYWTGNIRCS